MSIQETTLGKKNETQASLQILINKAVQLIEERYNDPPSAKELASYVGLSLSHFHRVFQAVVGEPVVKHVSRLRVERAASFLILSDWQAGDIGLACGFSTQASFSRAFKKFYGLTPEGFRRQHKTQPFLRSSLKSKKRQVCRDSHNSELTVRLESWPKYHLICLRAYCRISELHKPWKTLLNWGKTNLPDLDKARFLGLWFDDWNAKGDIFRYECALLTHTPIQKELPPPFFWRTLPAGMMAVSHAQGSLNAVDRAWRNFVFHWLPQSGFQPRCDFGIDEYPAELMLGTSLFQVGTLLLGRVSLNLCLPIHIGDYELAFSS